MIFYKLNILIWNEYHISSIYLTNIVGLYTLESYKIYF